MKFTLNFFIYFERTNIWLMGHESLKNRIKGEGVAFISFLKNIIRPNLLTCELYEKYRTGNMK